MYDPTSGRFLSEDPIGFQGGDANLLRYVGNSPTNATDPSGTGPTFYFNSPGTEAEFWKMMGPLLNDPTMGWRIRDILESDTNMPIRVGMPKDVFVDKWREWDARIDVADLRTLPSIADGVGKGCTLFREEALAHVIEERFQKAHGVPFNLAHNRAISLQNQWRKANGLPTILNQTYVPEKINGKNKMFLNIQFSNGIIQKIPVR